MSRYQLGWATCNEGLPCTHPHDAEFSSGWCDALYTLSEQGELEEDGAWVMHWNGVAWALHYEPGYGDIIHESECFAHVGDYDDEVTYVE